MVGTSILVKQSTGFILSIVFVFYKMLITREKEEWKTVAKIIIFRILGVLIPMILFLIFILKNNITNEFLNYAIYGIKQFSNFIPYTDLFRYYGIQIRFLAILIPSAIIYMYYKAVIKEDSSTKIVLFSYSCASFTAVYPISDDIHFIIASLPAIIGIIYIINNFLRENVKQKKHIEILKSIIDILIISVTIMAILNLVKYITNCNSYKNINHFKYIPVRRSFRRKNYTNRRHYKRVRKKRKKRIYIRC